MRNKIFVASLIILITLFVFNAVASVTVVNNTIITNYSSGGIIGGRIFLNVVDKLSSSSVTSNFLGNITLLNLLQLQNNLIRGTHYNCSTPNCEGDYLSQDLTTGFIVSPNIKKFAGFVINGNGVSVTSAKFSVQSNAAASCLPQINIDVLADNLDILTNSRSNGQSCENTYTGCYDSSNTNEALIVSNKEYCEKMTLPASSAFIVGGKIRNGTILSTLKIKLYDTTNLASPKICELPRHTQEFQELKCTINYTTSESREYYVCLTSNINGGYKIGWETQSPTCGTAEGFGSFNSDFNLFAEATQYSASPNFTINGTLGSLIDGYILSKYNRQCSPKSCVIPISFLGYAQDIQLNNAQIDYTTVGVPTSVNEMRELTYTDALVSGTNLSIDISKANFIIPLNSNESEFKLFINNTLIFQKNISIKQEFFFDVEPKSVIFGQNTEFLIFTDRTINSSKWTFGDGSAIQNVVGNKASHVYIQRNTPSFSLSITAKDNEGAESTKQINVTVGSPNFFANQTIIDYKKRIENLTAEINLQPVWMLEKLQRIVNIENMTSRILAIENNYNSALTETDFQNIMIRLIELNVPKSFAVLSSGQNLPLSVGHRSINPTYIETIDNQNVENNQALTDSIVKWMDYYYSTEISFKKFALFRDSRTDIIATFFSINTRPNQVNEKTYLIFGHNIEELGKYKMNYNLKSISGNRINYLELNQNSNESFEFLLVGDFSAETLGAYLSPKISSLTIEEAPILNCNLNNICETGEDEEICPEDCSRKWLKFSIISWIILGLAFVIVYIIIQEWYKKNYQKKLFSEENELYNLINFIYSARRSKVDDLNIKSKLLNQGWTSEKINFAFNKISGKRTGLFEIPLFTHKQHKQTIEKLSTKQGSLIDARFIKRPSFN